MWLSPRPWCCCLGDGPFYLGHGAFCWRCSTERTLSGRFVSPAAVQFLWFHRYVSKRHSPFAITFCMFVPRSYSLLRISSCWPTMSRTRSAMQEKKKAEANEKVSCSSWSDHGPWRIESDLLSWWLSVLAHRRHGSGIANLKTVPTNSWILIILFLSMSNSSKMLLASMGSIFHPSSFPFSLRRYYLCPLDCDGSPAPCPKVLRFISCAIWIKRWLIAPCPTSNCATGSPTLCCGGGGGIGAWAGIGLWPGFSQGILPEGIPKTGSFKDTP